MSSAWGPGNFENDGALDYLDDLVEGLIAKVNECFADEDLSSLDLGGETILIPSVEILTLLCEHYIVTPPDQSLVAQWHDRYLRIYDEQIDDLEPRGDFKEQRRAVIEQTFERLARVARQWAEAQSD
jgi:hypothetical protein